MSGPVNLADVARLAGVSPATASRALSDHPHVAEATRARVWAAARALEYVVSPEASGLARGRTGRIAVVVPHLARWWFGAALEGLSEVARAAATDVLLYRLGDTESRRAFFDELPARRRADAVVLLGFGVDERERGRLDRIGVGIVSAGTRIGSHPSVSIDEYAAGRQAVDHLLHLGHRRIGMIVTTDPELDPVQPAGRSSAYRRALADAGVPADPGLVATVPWSPEGGARAMGELLGLPEPPTAVYAHSDEVALGAVGTLRRAGLRVPEDVSVIGIDDHPLAALTDLSTVAQPAAEQGAVAARSALAGIAGEPVEPVVTVPTRLVIRGSTAPPADRRPARGVS
ncbi:LacI family transcriptional regulator [Pseudonocardia sp. EC080610-09]|uniref:LacI family DNA-binding transcriptional regulator n=1 Tax=unclassified Pseudonocardia TaxID=2619320 RepID=UPI0006CB5DF7|nr:MULTISPECIES: LacI family DNA-binding transcriptional regulator [unclassified Pseudonocardia]ALE73182.1 LacI family transcriptional regulator [Pseudonocardia sp. EC080625-04]ALL76511.1 LacI family transcriptional regulator [Pseudonocardia sp. EC080610-09]ALL83536.1 LacI family transcriptional regulator [Pseudonocardia sp. EC080619-01]